jgi:hypothetical protein
MYNLVGTKKVGEGRKQRREEQVIGDPGTRDEMIAKLANYQFMKELKKEGYKHIGIRQVAA